MMGEATRPAASRGASGSRTTICATCLNGNRATMTMGDTSAKATTQRHIFETSLLSSSLPSQPRHTGTETRMQVLGKGCTSASTRAAASRPTSAPARMATKETTVVGRCAATAKQMGLWFHARTGAYVEARTSALACKQNLSCIRHTAMSSRELRATTVRTARFQCAFKARLIRSAREWLQEGKAAFAARTGEIAQPQTFARARQSGLGTTVARQCVCFVQTRRSSTTLILWM
mmetsp:Transcript_10922/g.34758  ORF Transcript_10922/g.34758 Transcript_10922/m.34758 type:complete len:233 (-) Transcript_10922:675-1373(-)